MTGKWKLEFSVATLDVCSPIRLNDVTEVIRWYISTSVGDKSPVGTSVGD